MISSKNTNTNTNDYRRGLIWSRFTPFWAPCCIEILERRTFSTGLFLESKKYVEVYDHTAYITLAADVSIYVRAPQIFHQVESLYLLELKYSLLWIFFLDSDDSNDHIVAACIIEPTNKVAADFITV